MGQEITKFCDCKENRETLKSEQVSKIINTILIILYSFS